MEYSNNTHKISAKIKLLLCALVILFGLFIMIFPIGKPFLLSGSFAMNSSVGFLLGILIAHFLPTIIYCLVTIKTNKMEYIIFPALFQVAAEYFFFRDYETWISSDANAAIALVIIPIYLMLILAISYGLSFVVVKMSRYRSI